MGDTFLISGLMGKRAELIGQIEYHYRELAKLDLSLRHVEATLQLISPNIDIATQKPKEYRIRNSPFRNGEVPVLIMIALRESASPLPTNAIAAALAKSRLIPNTGEPYAQISKIVLSALQRMKAKGVIEIVGKIHGTGNGTLLWRLTT
jgi:hypothetical protein